MINKMIVQQKIREIEENLELIQESLPQESEEFRQLGLVKDGIYKRLEFSIQNIVDIFSMIHSDLRIGVPKDIDSIFEGLRKKKALPLAIITLAQEMKGLRNILIHRYGEINDDLIFELLTEQIDDFSKIIKALDNYLSKKKAS